MTQPYTYSWYINQFRTARQQAEEFILSVDGQVFLQRPNKNSWCIAECYSHLINFGKIYYETIKNGLKNDTKTANPDQPFKPRWLWRKVVSFFEPPYKIKVKTFEPFEPEDTTDLNKDYILDEFVGLQNLFISQLENAEQQDIDLNRVKVGNPMLTLLKMTISECYAVTDAHQRRHQWQAQQIMSMLNKKII